MANTLLVEYYGTNVGKIYFTDIDKRGQLGGSVEGNYIGGQDEYIMWGEAKVLQLTSDVLFSMAKGVLKYFSTASSSTLFATTGSTAKNGPPLTLTEGSYTTAHEVPRMDLGDTAGTFFSDAHMLLLADDKYSTGLAPVLTADGSAYTGGETGYFFGNDM